MITLEEAYRRIAHARDTQAAVLDLRGCHDLSDLHPLAGLTHLLHLDLSHCPALKDLSPLTGLIGLQQLEFIRCHALTDLRPLSALTGLQRLFFSRCHRLIDLSPLATLTNLQKLHLISCPAVSDIDPLGSLGRLQELYLGGSTVADLSPLASLTGLEQLSLTDCGKLEDLRPLGALATLNRLDLSFCSALSDVSPLAALGSLQQLNLSSCPALQHVRLGTLTGLRQLNLRDSRALADLTPLTTLTGLRHLELSGCSALVDLTPVAALTSLEQLYLSGCSAVADFTPLGALAQLQQLYLNDCVSFADLSPLAGLTTLQILHLGNCSTIADLRPLRALTALQQLNLNGCFSLNEVSSLGTLTGLRQLYLRGCKTLCEIPVSTLTSLQELNLGNCTGLSDLSPLRPLTALKQLYLGNCPALTDLSPLRSLVNLQQLDLSQCAGITDFSPIATLVSLQQLDLTGCLALREISVLATLAQLQRLHLGGCAALGDLSPLAKLTRLQRLDLTGCAALADFAVLAGLSELTQLRIQQTGMRALPCWVWTQLRLQELYADTLDDVPRELLSQSRGDNCLPRLRAWWQDQQSGAVHEPEAKVFLLGNGFVGKTQLFRLLCGLAFDPTVPSTHGVQLASLPPQTPPVDTRCRLNLWDFGGQDIYHGTHALFLKSHAVFLILWTPELEAQARLSSSAPASAEAGYCDRPRPLAYWLDYVRQLASPDSQVLVVQSQCDDRAQEQPLDEKLLTGLAAPRVLSFSARTGRNRSTLFGNLHDAIEDLNARHAAPTIGHGWASVRDRCRQLAQEGTRALTRAEFESICRDTDGVSAPDALLYYMHHCGVIFHAAHLFGGQIILDQNWALDAIYTVFDRTRAVPRLQNHGTFTRPELDWLVWGEGRRRDGQEPFSPAEQHLFLSMMESCGICFYWRRSRDGEKIYIAPELLPSREAIADQLFGRIHDHEQPTVRIIYHYGFLHDGVIRTVLAAVGQQARDAAVYWRDGLWLYESRTEARAIIQATAADATGAGNIVLQVFGPRGLLLAELLHRVVSEIDPQPSHITGWNPQALPNSVDSLSRLQEACFASSDRPEIFISYAWGDDTEIGKRRHQAVESLCRWLDSRGFQVVRDIRAMRPGDSISAFIRKIGQADRVIAILSDKYLRSIYCMTELYSLWESSQNDRDVFQKRVCPQILPDARIERATDRLDRARHWADEHQKLLAYQRDLVNDFGPGDEEELKLLRSLAGQISEILRWLNDVLMPRPFTGPEGNFDELQEFLKRSV